MHLHRDTAQKHTLKLLFLNTTDEDTTFLTKNLNAEVVRTNDPQRARDLVANDLIDGVFVDIGAARVNAELLAYEAPVVFVTDLERVPEAIRRTKAGGSGFVVKNLSSPENVMKVIRFAKRTFRARACSRAVKPKKAGFQIPALTFTSRESCA